MRSSRATVFIAKLSRFMIIAEEKPDRINTGDLWLFGAAPGDSQSRINWFATLFRGFSGFGKRHVGETRWVWNYSQKGSGRT